MTILVHVPVHVLVHALDAALDAAAELHHELAAGFDTGGGGQDPALCRARKREAALEYARRIEQSLAFGAGRELQARTFEAALGAVGRSGPGSVQPGAFACQQEQGPRLQLAAASPSDWR